MDKTAKFMVIAALFIGILIGLVISIFNSEICFKNRDAINCISRYLQTQDKNYKSVITACKAEQKEEKKRTLRALAY